MKHTGFHIVIGILLAFLPFCLHASDAEKLLEKGRQQYMAQRYAEALETYTLAMKSARNEGNEQAYLRSMGNIGTVYDVFSNYGRALHYYEKVLQGASGDKSQDLYTTTLVKMVVCYCNANQPSKARQYLELQKRYPQAKSKLSKYHLMTNQGLVDSKEGNHTQAVDYYKKALEEVKRNRLEAVYAVPILNEVASEFFAISQPDSAIAYYKKSERLALGNNLAGYLYDIYKAFATYYQNAGNTQKAYDYLLKSEKYGDQAFSKEQINKASNKLISEQEDEAEFQIGQLSDTIKTQTLVIVAFVLLSLGLTVSICIIVWQRKRQEKSYQLIVNKDDEIATLSENALVKPVKNLSMKQTGELISKIENVMNNPAIVFKPDFNLAMLCQEVGSNTKYVSMVINESYNKNFKTLLNEKRIREATKRLVDAERYADYAIQDIAISLGYNSATSFIIAFKKIMGMTPAVYKKIKKSQHRSGAETN